MKYLTYPINISIPVETFHALTDACGEGYYGDVAETVVNDLILQWLAKQRDKVPAAAEVPAPARADGEGYQWKRLFLSDGTRLRTSFRGQQRFARVEGAAIISDGAVTTPSRFANWDGCGSRNAWQAIWLQFPGECGWTPASICRPK